MRVYLTEMVESLSLKSMQATQFDGIVRICMGNYIIIVFIIVFYFHPYVKFVIVESACFFDDSAICH